MSQQDALAVRPTIPGHQTSCLAPERDADVLRMPLAGTTSWRCPQRWRSGSRKMRPGPLQPPRARLSDPRKASPGAPPAHRHSQRGAPLQVPQDCCRDLCATPPSLVPRVLAGAFLFLCSPARSTSHPSCHNLLPAAGPAQRGGELPRQGPQNWSFTHRQKACRAAALHSASAAQHGRRQNFCFISLVSMEGSAGRASPLEAFMHVRIAVDGSVLKACVYRESGSPSAHTQ